MSSLDDIVQQPEFWGRFDLMRNNAIASGREFDDQALLNPDSDFMTRYVELEEIMNDRDLWTDPDYWPELWDFLVEYDLVPNWADMWDYIVG